MAKSNVPIEDFIKDYSTAIDYVKQREFIFDSFSLLNILFHMAECFLEDKDYYLFRKQIDRILRVPGRLKQEAGKPIARSYEAILSDWGNLLFDIKEGDISH